MTRLEQLTLDLADDVLSDSEGRELQELLKESEPAGQVHIRILQIEAGLRASRRNLELASPIMARLRTQLADSIARDVMKEIKALPMPSRGWQGVPRKRTKTLTVKILRFPNLRGRSRTALKPVLLALAACITLAAGVWMFGPTMGESALAEVQGVGLSLERAGQSIPAVAGTRLQTGDLLRTPSNVTAVIGFAPENTRVTLQPGTDFRLASMSRGKRFVLGAGKIEASVARQQPWKPMIFSTAQAEARVLGTKFALTATTNATRLEVTEGKVKLTRMGDDVAVKVPAGYYAVAAAATELAAQPLTGSILREYWTNLPGDYYITFLTSHADYPDHPSGQEYLNRFEAPSHWGTNYGARLYGYLHPPKTGDYTFWITAGDGGELWLSPDDKPENKQQIGNADGCAPREWTRLRKQQSSAITLVAGRKYYIEALHKQGKKEDHLAVAWQGQGRAREVIAGEFLSPFTPKPKEKKR